MFMANKNICVETQNVEENRFVLITEPPKSSGWIKACGPCAQPSLGLGREIEGPHVASAVPRQAGTGRWWGVPAGAGILAYTRSD